MKTRNTALRAPYYNICTICTWNFNIGSFFCVQNYFQIHMTYDQFISSLTQPQPPKELPVLLKALWYDANDNWEAAHDIAQSSEGTKSYDRLHAYLHRVEGDTWNAGYWYRRAGADVFKGSLKEEWQFLVESLI